MNMESLELPCDILWQSNVDSLPLSQLSCAKNNDILIIEDNFVDELLPLENETDLLIVQTDDNMIFSPDHLIELHELENMLSDDDSSSCTSTDQWLDQPINIPLMEEYPAPSQEPRIHPVKAENTAQLLKEFNNVYDKVELTHLTPPQTPPQSFVDASKKEYIFPVQNPPMYQIQPTPQFQPVPVVQSPPPPPATPSLSLYEQAINLVQSQMPQDIQREIDAVDELVRSRAENLPDWTDDDASSISGTSNSSMSSYSPRSDTYSSSNYSNDDEWSPGSSKKAGGKMRTNKNTNEIVGKKKTRPYGRSTEDRKYRKKEQNKSAANRYRQKKKAECEIILEEEKNLAKRNEELQSEYQDVRREIKYLKDLMRELYKAKGLI